MSVCGQALNTAEQVAVEASLLKIRMNEQFKDVRFWGRVNAVQRNYLVIAASKIVDREIHTKYFASNNGGLDFSELPPVEDWVAERCRSGLYGRFTGNESFVYKNKSKKTDGEASDEEEEELESEEDESGEASVEKPPKQRLTELHRLAYTVGQVDHDCALAPVGAYALTANRQIINNPNFTGLSPSEAKSLSSFCHFRTPEDPHTIAKLRRKNVDNQGDIFDPIDSDLPNGVWSLVPNPSGLSVTLRSLKWPGYEFSYNIASAKSNHGYFGTGEQNFDIAFML